MRWYMTTNGETVGPIEGEVVADFTTHVFATGKPAVAKPSTLRRARVGLAGCAC